MKNGARGLRFRVFCMSAFQASALAVHILHNDIIDLAQAPAVFQDLPGLVGMEMDLDQILIAYCQQAVTFEMLGDIIKNLILVQVLAFDQQLCIISEFNCLLCIFSLLLQ